MSTLVEAVPAAPTTPTETPRVVLQGVSWRAYEQVVEALGETHARLTYDSGTLEIMSPSPEHELLSQALLMAVRVLAKELRVAIKSLGSTTLKRELRARGLEPDQCFYTANWPRVRGKRRFDLNVDPPPDLAIEVDVMNSSLDRVSIYEALRVPELWRHANERLEVLLLQPEGGYRSSRESPTFPGVPIGDIAAFLETSEELDDDEWTERFRAWVRQHLERGHGA